MQAYARLIATCLDEHYALATGTDAMALLRPIGWMRIFSRPEALAAALEQAETARRDYGIGFAALDGKALAAAEPSLLVERAGASTGPTRSRSATRMR